MPAALPRIHCRQIRITDIDAVVNLLTRGMRIRTREFWVHAFGQLMEHSTPPGFPKFGYLLEARGTPVGVILQIYSTIIVKGKRRARCNMSSWYVEPPFRSYASMLNAQAGRLKDITYFNITPLPHTLPILEAQGYLRYCSGRFMAVPALSASSKRARVQMVTGDLSADDDLQSFEVELLLSHANYGCISLTCNSENRRHPFVFLPLRRAGVVSFAYLAYCRDLEEFIRFAGPLGRFLAFRGFPLVVLDANGPIEGLIGKYSKGTPKYFKGSDQPRLGDWAYSERVMFGF